MNIKRKSLLALGFGLWVLGFGFWGQKAWADQADRVSFGGIKKIVIFQQLNPWINTKENLSETDKVWKNLHLTRNIDIQSAAADYVRKNLDEKLKKCIEVVSPVRGGEGEYYEDPSNRLLAITWDIGQWIIDGKPQALASFSLSEAHPANNPNGYLLRTRYFMPTQAMPLHDEAQIDADIKIVAEHLMKKIVYQINASDNSCER